jgi:hypothetical protein
MTVRPVQRDRLGRRVRRNPAHARSRRAARARPRPDAAHRAHHERQPELAEDDIGLLCRRARASTRPTPTSPTSRRSCVRADRRDVVPVQITPACGRRTTPSSASTPSTSTAATCRSSATAPTRTPRRNCVHREQAEGRPRARRRGRQHAHSGDGGFTAVDSSWTRRRRRSPATSVPSPDPDDAMARARAGEPRRAADARDGDPPRDEAAAARRRPCRSPNCWPSRSDRPHTPRTAVAVRRSTLPASRRGTARAFGPAWESPPDAPQVTQSIR